MKKKARLKVKQKKYDLKFQIVTDGTGKERGTLLSSDPVFSLHWNICLLTLLSQYTDCQMCYKQTLHSWQLLAIALVNFNQSCSKVIRNKTYFKVSFCR